MYTVLVVDDEKYAAEGIRVGINWKDLNVSSVEAVLDAQQAKEYFMQNRVDLLLCDIEMPNENGLQLATWVMEKYPNTKIIFLTAHANFEYAQQTLRIGASDYILKPADHELLHEIIRKALFEVEEEEKNLTIHRQYKRYAEEWRAQLPVMQEKFWRDLLEKQQLFNWETIKAQLEMYEINLEVDSQVLLLLLNVEWMESIDTKTECMMEMAMQEIFKKDILSDYAGTIFSVSHGASIMIIYNAENIEQRMFEKHLMRVIEKIRREMASKIECVISQPVYLEELGYTRLELMWMDGYFSKRNRGILWQNQNQVVEHKVFDESILERLKNLLTTNQYDQLYTGIDEYLNTLRGHPSEKEFAHAFFHALVSALFYDAHQQGISLCACSGMMRLLDENRACRSVDSLHKWSKTILQTYVANHPKRNYSAVIKQVMEYIEQRLDEELTRDNIARQVYLNPSYLSRLFHMETGMSLTNYIMNARIEKAKRLLTTTEDRIASVAESVGYGNFSYFTKVFHTATGIGPRDYRKKFKNNSNK